MNRGILIVFPYARLDAHPTLRGLLRCLANEWSFIHVVSAGGDVRCAEANEVDTCLASPSAHGALNPFVGRGSFFEQPRARMRAMLAPRWLTLKRGRYAAVIGVDPEGLVQARRLNRSSRLPLVYLSFEIMFRDEIAGTPLESFKLRETEAAREAALVLVQDEERAAALTEETGIPRERMELVPNGPPEEPVSQSSFLRDRLPIPDGKRIVLYAGNLKTWASRDFLDEMVHCWPDQFVLALHPWAPPDSCLRSHLNRLKRTGRVFVTDTPLPVEQLANLYASADFGLAPFLPTPDSWDTGRNIFHMGLSSGKVGYYAMSGLPMLASGIPVFRREFREYDCGRVYSHMHETGALLRELDNRYAHHRDEAKRFYRERMDPGPGLRRFCDRLKSVTRV